MVRAMLIIIYNFSFDTSILRRKLYSLDCGESAVNVVCKLVLKHRESINLAVFVINLNFITETRVSHMLSSLN